MRRRVVVIGGTIASVYACSLIYRSLAPRLPRVDFASRDADARYTPQSTDERLEVFERIAEKYDRATRFHEWMWGIKAQRKTILQHARGKGE
jgi:hypothetical protein